MNRAKFKSARHQYKLARSNALSGPGYTYYDFLGVRLTNFTPPSGVRHELLFDDWIPYRSSAERPSEDYAWYAEVDIFDLLRWSKRLDTDIYTMHTRYRAALRRKPHAKVSDIMITDNVQNLAAAGKLVVTNELYPHGREIKVYLYE